MLNGRFMSFVDTPVSSLPFHGFQCAGLWTDDSSDHICFLTAIDGSATMNGNEERYDTEEPSVAMSKHI